jgi:hypothetical protein
MAAREEPLGSLVPPELVSSRLVASSAPNVFSPIDDLTVLFILNLLGPAALAAAVSACRRLKKLAHLNGIWHLRCASARSQRLVTLTPDLRGDICVQTALQRILVGGCIVWTACRPRIPIAPNPILPCRALCGSSIRIPWC